MEDTIYPVGVTLKAVHPRTLESTLICGWLAPSSCLGLRDKKAHPELSWNSL